MNMRTVVLDDGPRPVNDLLVAFDLRDDLLLHFQRRQGDLIFGKMSFVLEKAALAQLPGLFLEVVEGAT